MRGDAKSMLRLLILPLLALTASANGATILPGVYQLHNHPDGNEVPPPYGLRLDEMVDATAGHDIFTFDFDHANSDMKLYYNSVLNKITIDGVVHGGRDSGGGYFNDVYLGLYTVHFEYTIGVGLAAPDDDLQVVAPGGVNFGTITGPGGAPIHSLMDKSDGNNTFRFGDEDNDLGHRGFNGISGWGWMMVDTRYTPAMDWLFTAEYIAIPEPTSALALGLGALLIGAARRRR